MRTFHSSVLFLIFAFHFTTIRPVYSANILFHFDTCSYSHRLAVWPLVENLADKGHNITFLSSFPPKIYNPKITEMIPNPDFRKKLNESGTLVMPEKLLLKPNRVWNTMWRIGLSSCEVTLKQPRIKEWIKNAHFDLVIIDALSNECGFGLAYKFRAKTILFSTFSMPMWIPDIFGHIPESSWIPDLQYHYEEPMSFMEKVYTTLLPLYWHFWIRQFNYLPKMEAVIREELDLPDLPPILELERNTSLVFVNTHYSSEYARSLPPIYVPVGGMHIVESDKHVLPKDIQYFMDESGPDGVILVSFGSFLKVSAFDPQLRSIFNDVFRSLKSIRFIWLSDMKNSGEASDNVMLLDWAPQQEILAHKKVKGFISHGGLLSITEAVYYGVPLIIFPVFADQDYNANLVEKNGRGIKLDITRVTKEELSWAIMQILTETKYISKMAEASKEFKDRPMKPLDTAAWWTEYVLRHEDTSFLKPSSIRQTWYERRLLDVWLFVFSSVVFSFSIVCYVIFKCICYCLSRVTRMEGKLKRS